MTEHPDELLAAYVDGVAAGEEVTLVERHLATCEACRSDVELARESRAALAALPELDAPPGLVTLPAPDEAPGTWAFPSRPARRARGWWRPTTWSPRLARGVAAAGLAAAAVVAIVVLTHGGGPLPSTGPVRPAAAPAARLPGVVQSGTDYSAAALDALARTLATDRRDALAAGEASVPAPSPLPGKFTALQPSSDSIAASALRCIQRGAGLPSSLTATYLEQATYQTTPAYVGAFTIPATATSPGHLIVAAVSVRGCQPLHVARLTL